MNNLYCIEDGDRIQGDRDDRDLYVIATTPAEAVTIWRQYYGLDDEIPYRIWLIQAATVEGPPRALEWLDDITEQEV